MQKITITDHQGRVEPSILKQLEDKYKITLPLLFKHFISQFNNARLFQNVFEFQLEDYGTIKRDVTFIDFTISNIATDMDMLQQVWGNQGYFPFGETAGGDYICFDFREQLKTHELPVVNIIHDLHDDNGIPTVCTISSNFREFLNALYTTEDEAELERISKNNISFGCDAPFDWEIPNI